MLHRAKTLAVSAFAPIPRRPLPHAPLLPFGHAALLLPVGRAAPVAPSSPSALAALLLSFTHDASADLSFPSFGPSSMSPSLSVTPPGGSARAAHDTHLLSFARIASSAPSSPSPAPPSLDACLLPFAHVAYAAPSSPSPTLPSLAVCLLPFARDTLSNPASHSRVLLLSRSPCRGCHLIPSCQPPSLFLSRCRYSCGRHEPCVAIVLMLVAASSTEPDDASQRIHADEDGTTLPWLRL